MKKVTVQEVIISDLDRLLKAKSQHNGLNIQDLQEIGAYVGASALRVRFAEKKEVTPEEINGVYGIIGNFYISHFKETFGQNEFNDMMHISLELLNRTTFDQDSKLFYDQIMSLKK